MSKLADFLLKGRGYTVVKILAFLIFVEEVYDCLGDKRGEVDDDTIKIKSHFYKHERIIAEYLISNYSNF